MSYEIILEDEVIKIVHITSATFKTWKIWRVQFHDGKEAVLYKCGNEWMQRIEDQLEIQFLIAIGKYIDEHSLKNPSLLFDN
ncbi:MULTISPECIES: hypothetical protein [unclassified Mucilaginibacter]|uniref:hypothetical protein n=1 Tax=unclassified Mucilaginibacter TaxID=2617802 RepID=UPI002AC95647|nr:MULTISPECIES: hypothetical protein [unclassified Mucilaginibacter]MEB0261111.1 hypothetical protein [Mucilaginibacter sp. 10I4]MEB0280486.1 hypothetical protein [Mucilaginibacter sp. 10B2]MEB0301308.1 hypothetical protein [Mucilaginibacter sp. 5C4]WPX22461.1 hypothetical protein RHM67_14330 [Mucilaginibacter sp. 5C4]